MTTLDTDLNLRLSAYESRNRLLTRIVVLNTLALLIVGSAFLGSCGTMSGRNDSGMDSPPSLKVRELIVVDPSGVERVRVGGDLPDAVIDGKRIPRGERAAGVLLYDGTGQERGGYVTFEPSGNVGLTLDSRKGQSTLFVAGPEGGSALKLWNGDDLIELRSDDDGSRLTAVKEGRVVVQNPAITLGDDARSAYRQALTSMSYEDVLKACQQRYTEAACRECLDMDR